MIESFITKHWYALALGGFVAAVGGLVGFTLLDNQRNYVLFDSPDATLTIKLDGKAAYGSRDAVLVLSSEAKATEKTRAPLVVALSSGKHRVEVFDRSGRAVETG